jgi:hypothetical protein
MEMKNATVIFLTCVMFAGEAIGASPLLITDKIDAKKVIDGLPLINHEVLKSGNGRKKQLWSIKGYGEFSKLEIIGDDQSDADQVGMNCAVYDKNGKTVSPVAPSAPCHVMFVKLLSKFTSTPEAFAKMLLEEAVQSRRTADRTLDDFLFETDGEFSFVRRRSHLNRRWR